MEQLPNGDMKFYYNGHKILPFYVLLSLPFFSIVIIPSFFMSTPERTIFLLVLGGFLIFTFGLSYLVWYFLCRKGVFSFTVRENSLECRTPRDTSFISFQDKIGFTTPLWNDLNLQTLILITKDFKKKYTSCCIGFLDPQERILFFDVLQSKGLTYFSPGSDIIKE